MERMDLVLWKDRGVYGICEDVKWDVFEDCVDEWGIENQRIHPSSSEAVGRWEKRSEESEGLPWKMPEIRYKLIATGKIKERLIEICGSEDKVMELQNINELFVSWGYSASRNPDLTLGQQIEYLRLVIKGLGDVSGLTLRNYQATEELARYLWLSSLRERIAELEERV